MNWKDRLTDIEFTITTGDGKVFTPLWKNGEKSIDFNTSNFDFINLEGSLVTRKKAKGSKYPLVFWFQGEDNISLSNEFEESAKDNRIWTIEHPFYGTLKGQPLNVSRNDNNYGITEINVEFWESIIVDYPNTNISVTDEVNDRVLAINSVILAAFVESSNPTISNINTVKNNVTTIASKFKPDSLNYIDYKNIVAKAVKNSDNLVTDTLTAYQSIQEIVVAPANFVDSVNNKLESYINAYNEIKSGLSNAFSKYYFESQGASIIAGAVKSAINSSTDDYISRSEIESVNSKQNALSDDYLETLDNNQINVYDIDNKWSQDLDIQQSLSELVSFANNQLFNLSFNARQERFYQLEKDSNLILLTHRFVGLDANDENIEAFRKLNNIRNNELFKIKKDRIIKYYAV